MKKKPWNRFEAFAQRLVEGSFQRLFGEQSLVEEVSVQLAEAVEAHQINGRLPEQFMIYVHPDDLQTAVLAEESHQAVEARFLEAITSLAQMLQIDHSPNMQIQLLGDAELGDGIIRVESQKKSDNALATQVHKRPLSNGSDLEAINTLDAFLIITGQQHIPLEKPLVTLGRSLENDIVLDAATVSRKHAQIRWRLGRFVIYDLSKRGRTVVNGKRVSEHVLEPGDVIALSHLMIIYGEGHTRPNVIKKQNPVDDSTRPMDKFES